MLSSPSENLIPFYVCCRLTVVYLTFQDKINLHFTVIVKLSLFAVIKYWKGKKKTLVRHPYASIHFWNINKMKNLRAHIVEVHYLLPCLTERLYDWARIRTHSFFYLVAHPWNKVQGWNGPTPNYVDFSVVCQDATSPKVLCFFSPQPFCLIVLIWNLEFAKLKLILILHTNTTFFFASEFKFSI